MAVVKQLDIIKSWLEKEICSQFKFKQADDDHVDASYKYNLVNPNVFILYVPPKEFLEIDENRVPSICIQFEDGQESFSDKGGALSIRLIFSIFNPGEHTEGSYKRNTEGWRDVWNFIDYTMERIRNTELIDDLRIVKENGIKYAPIIEDGGQIPYPYYFAWISFSVEYGIPSSKEEIRHLL